MSSEQDGENEDVQSYAGRMAVYARDEALAAPDENARLGKALEREIKHEHAWEV